MDVIERGHLPETKEARGEAYDEEFGGGMECGTDYFRVGEVEVVAGVHTPAGGGYVVFGFV